MLLVGGSGLLSRRRGLEGRNLARLGGTLLSGSFDLVTIAIARDE